MLNRLSKLNRFLKLQRKFFALNTFKATTTYNNHNIVSSIPSHESQLKLSQPLEALMAVLNTCELKAIGFWANQLKVELPKIEIETKGTWDNASFLPGSKYTPQQNTYQDVELIINVDAKQDAKLDEVFEKGSNSCPVYNTLKLAGVNISHKVNYKQ